MQFFAVALITSLFYLLVRARYFALGWPLAICDENMGCPIAVPLLRTSYLLTAGGVTLTNNRIIARTTQWARHEARSTLPNEFKFSAEAVAAQLSIAAIGSIIEELDTPSQIVVPFGQWIGGIWLGAILWPAMWSVGVAAMGSLIHALYLSMHSMSVDRP